VREISPEALAIVNLYWQRLMDKLKEPLHWFSGYDYTIIEDCSRCRNAQAAREANAKYLKVRSEKDDFRREVSSEIHLLRKAIDELLGVKLGNQKEAK